MKQTKIDTLFKAQIQKMTPYSREEQKLKKKLERVNVFRLTGYLRTAILADTI